jgi:hypothetical protein
MGNPKPRAVSAQTYQKFPQLVKAPVFDVEDSAYGMIRFEKSTLPGTRSNLSDQEKIDVAFSRRKPRATLKNGQGKVQKASRLNLRPSPDLVSQEIQDLLCLFACRLSFAFHPSFKRLWWNPYALN